MDGSQRHPQPSICQSAALLPALSGIARRSCVTAAYPPSRLMFPLIFLSVGDQPGLAWSRTPTVHAPRPEISFQLIKMLNHLPRICSLNLLVERTLYVPAAVVPRLLRGQPGANEQQHCDDVNLATRCVAVETLNSIMPAFVTVPWEHYLTRVQCSAVQFPAARFQFFPSHMCSSTLWELSKPCHAMPCE